MTYTQCFDKLSEMARSQFPGTEPFRFLEQRIMEDIVVKLPDEEAAELAVNAAPYNAFLANWIEEYLRNGKNVEAAGDAALRLDPRTVPANIGKTR